MNGHYHYDGEEYCEYCLPADAAGPDVDIDAGGQDTPANCSVCGRPLDYSLTPDGVDYVLSAVEKALADGPGVWGALYDGAGTYYRGARRVEIVRDWARDLLGYRLAEGRREMVQDFLARTEGEWP
jgi:hypothetical protein